MKVQDIEIHAGRPDFQFTPIRRLEAKCESATVLSAAPSMDEVNAKLREMAVGLGANAIVNVEYRSGASLTSWRSMTGTGLAVHKMSDEIACPICAEAVKRAALKCRYCGSDIPESARTVVAPAPTEFAEFDSNGIRTSIQEPLRSTNNPQVWIFVVGALFLLLMFIGMSQ